MTNAQDALTLTADVNADLAKIVEAGVLRAHQTGLKAVAALVAEEADEVAKLQMALEEERAGVSGRTPPLQPARDEHEDKVADFRRRGLMLMAKSEVLTSLNDKIMARMKAIDLVIGAKT